MNTNPTLTASLFLGIFLLLNLSLKSQNNSDTISIMKKGSSYAYYMNNETLSKAQLMNLLNENNAAIKLMEKSNNFRVASYCFAITGGICIGYSLGCVIAGGWVGAKLSTVVVASLLGTGAGLVAIGICFEVDAKNKAKKAVAIYNNSKKQNNTTLNLGLCTNGMVVKLNF